MSITCPKCNQLMEEGYIPDYGHGGIARQPQWVEGQVKPSFWHGTTSSLEKPQKHPIKAYRCAKCGLLEFYATGE